MTLPRLSAYPGKLTVSAGSHPPLEANNASSAARVLCKLDITGLPRHECAKFFKRSIRDAQPLLLAL